MTQSSDQQPVSCVLFGIGSAQSYYVHSAPAKWVKGSINPMSALWSALNSLLNALQYHLSSLLEGWQAPAEVILFDLMHVIGAEWKKVLQTTVDDPLVKALRIIKQQDSWSIRFCRQVYVFVYGSQTERILLQKIKYFLCAYDSHLLGNGTHILLPLFQHAWLIECCSLAWE